MKNLSSLIVPVLLLLMAETGLQARPGYLKARERTHTVRVDGGLSWVFGSGFDKMEGARANATQPFVGVGALFNFSPRHRVGLDYSYSRMVRKQTGALTTLPGGSVEGDVYKDLTTHLNSLSLTGEYELLSLLRSLEGRLADGVWTADEGDHRPVGGFAGVYIQHFDAFHRADGGYNGVYHLTLPSFTVIGNTFDELLH